MSDKPWSVEKLAAVLDDQDLGVSDLVDEAVDEIVAEFNNWTLEERFQHLSELFGQADTKNPYGISETLEDLYRDVIVENGPEYGNTKQEVEWLLDNTELTTDDIREQVL